MGNINLCCGDDSVGNQRLMRNNTNRPELNPSRSQTMETLDDHEILNATRDNNVSVVKFFIDNGADINAQTAISKDTALHIAARMNSRVLIAMLIGSGADTTIRNAAGQLASDLGNLQPLFKQLYEISQTPKKEDLDALSFGVTLTIAKFCNTHFVSAHALYKYI